MKRSRKFNPLKVDPTRTTMIRQHFAADMARRFARLRRDVVKWIGTDDELGLDPLQSTQLILINAGAFRFSTTADKLTAFNTWFKQQVDARIFIVPEGTDPSKPWTAPYIESSFKMGIVNAYVSSRSGLASSDPEFIDQTQADFLRSSFGSPEALDKARLLGTKTYTQLQGVTESMGSEMNRILAAGMLNGKSATQIAKEMASSIDGLTEKRALMIARTETISAHAEGQLLAFEKLGIEELGLMAEWSTAGDDRVCPECAALQGKIFTVKEAQGMIPIHPQCRCSWIPSLPQTREK